MPDQLHVRNVVLGAGAMGCAAAYQLAKRGEPVALIDQFAPGHTRGSSHGTARVIRHSYADVRYARLMPEAYRAWSELEADAGYPLVVRTGGVSFGPSEVGYVAQVAASLETIGIPRRRMSGDEWSWNNPAFAMPPDYDVVFEPDAGLVAADRAVRAVYALASHFELRGRSRLDSPRTATPLPNTPIRRIDLDANHPTLVGDHLVITADRLIVAAGAWVGKLLPGLAESLVPTHQQVLYFRPEDESAFTIGRFPIFIFVGEGDGNVFYGMPGFLGTGVKVARHSGPPVDPDATDRAVDDAYRETVREFLRGHIPMLSQAPIDREEVCLYTVAPGEEFVVGPLAGRPEVIVASPCSGHGFKFAPLVGRVLADLATTGTTEVDISAWRAPGSFGAGAATSPRGE
jgi:sarcosine oxidase